MSRLKYISYLQSERWYQIRDLVRKRDGNKCVKCGTHLVTADWVVLSQLFILKPAESEDKAIDKVTSVQPNCTKVSWLGRSQPAFFIFMPQESDR